MTRNTLPQNWLIKEGTVLEDFSNIDDWLVPTNYGGTGTKEIVDINGVPFLKLTPATAGGNVGFAKTINLKISELGNMYIDVYVYDNTALGECRINFSSVTNITKMMYQSLTPAQLKKGLNRIPLMATDWVSSGGELYSSTMVRLLIRSISGTGKILPVAVSNLRYGHKSKSCICMEFDDGYDTDGYAYMKSKGIKGSFSIYPSAINALGKMSKTLLDEAYGLGWAICNHSMDDTNFTTLTQSEIEGKLLACTQLLVENGWTRSSRHVTYPSGGYNDTVNAAMIDADMLTGRSGEGYQYMLPGEMYNLTRKTLSSSITLATAKSWIDYAAKMGIPLIILTHQLGGDTGFPVEDFYSLIDYGIVKKIHFLTRDEFYEGLTNPRYRSLPLSR